LIEKCEHRTIVSENDLERLQNKGLLRGDTHDEIATIWQELSTRSSLVAGANSSSTSSAQQYVSFTFDETLKQNTDPSNDICICFAPNGISTATKILEELKRQNISSCLFKEENAPFDERSVERKIANSFATVVLLTAGSLQTPEVLFALQAASFHFKEHSRIILVHIAESCNFPVPPPSVVDCFSEKAITWLSCTFSFLL
jgi:hypothetical protein